MADVAAVTNSGPMFTFFAFFGTIAAAAKIGKQIDELMCIRHKELISDYIFSGPTSNFRNFEHSLINAIIGIFLAKGTDVIEGRRVFAASLILSCLLFAGNAYFNIWKDLATLRWMAVPAFFMAVLLTSYFCFASDYWSVFVTKKIFYGRSYRPYFLPPLILLNILLSLLPFLCLAILMAVGFVEQGKGGLSPEGGSTYLFRGMAYGTAASLIGALFMTAIQLVALAGGIVTRLFTKLALLLKLLAQVSKARDFPVTICLGLGALVFNLIILIW